MVRVTEDALLTARVRELEAENERLREALHEIAFGDPITGPSTRPFARAALAPEEPKS